MKMIFKPLAIIVLAITLFSCAVFAPAPTATPVPTATSLPTSTPQPTSTPAPTSTPLPPTATPGSPDLKMPTGKPLSDWQGIPVMPAAIAGDGDEKGYTFTIKATADEIQGFYQKAMKKLGWNMFATGQGGTKAVLLIFMKGTDIVSISILPQADGIMYVLLVK